MKKETTQPHRKAKMVGLSQSQLLENSSVCVSQTYWQTPILLALFIASWNNSGTAALHRFEKHIALS